MNPIRFNAILGVAAALLLLATGGAAAAESRTLCVFDPSGANGDAFQLMKDYRTAAIGWGVDFTLKPYTDEKTAAEDFKAGQCDAALLTGTRVRPFQRFSASIEAFGALPTYKHLRQVIKNLGSPKAAKLMKKGDYEVVAIFPGGRVLLYVNDRNINSVADMAGKRLATLDYDAAAKLMVRHVGASLVTADLGTFAGMFNNNNVDICYAPASAFSALELNKGIGSKGGIVDYPLGQLTFQVLTRSDRIPEGFGNQSRKWAAGNFKRFISLAERAEQSIPKKLWIRVSDEDRVRYDKMFQGARIRVRDELKAFDKTMLRLLRRTRCKIDGARAECTERKE